MGGITIPSKGGGVAGARTLFPATSAVEVKGDGDGFLGSWCVRSAAKLAALLRSRRCRFAATVEEEVGDERTVRYTDLLADDGKTALVETIDLARLRPLFAASDVGKKVRQGVSGKRAPRGSAL
jgi:hypothetical protein